MTFVFYMMILNPHTYEQNLAMTIVFSMILNPHTYEAEPCNDFCVLYDTKSTYL